MLGCWSAVKSFPERCSGPTTVERKLLRDELLTEKSAGMLCIIKIGWTHGLVSLIQCLFHSILLSIYSVDSTPSSSNSFILHSPIDVSLRRVPRGLMRLTRPDLHALCQETKEGSVFKKALVQNVIILSLNDITRTLFGSHLSYKGIRVL